MVLRPSGAECSAGRAVGPQPDSGKSFRPAGAKPFEHVITIDMASLRDEGMIIQNLIAPKGAPPRKHPCQTPWAGVTPKCRNETNGMKRRHKMKTRDRRQNYGR